MSSIDRYDEKGNLIGQYFAPFVMEVNFYVVGVYGKDLSGMKLRGKCEMILFVDVRDFNEVDLSGFMELEIGMICVRDGDKGLLKLLELNYKKIECNEKLERIVNKYLKESDPLMRDFEGFKLEMAVNGYGERL